MYLIPLRFEFQLFLINLLLSQEIRIDRRVLCTGMRSILRHTTLTQFGILLESADIIGSVGVRALNVQFRFKLPPHFPFRLDARSPILSLHIASVWKLAS